MAELKETKADLTELHTMKKEELREKLAEAKKKEEEDFKEKIES